jgi:K+-transporting ATPase KdpF subunit
MMEIEYLLGIIVSVVVIAYLIYALVYAEKF